MDEILYVVYDYLGVLLTAFAKSFLSFLLEFGVDQIGGNYCEEVLDELAFYLWGRLFYS